MCEAVCLISEVTLPYIQSCGFESVLQVVIVKVFIVLMVNG
jgi:hypothetical protein